jgi:hypothetical protein
MHYSEWESIWATLIEDASDTGVFVFGFGGRATPGNLHDGRMCEVLNVRERIDE